MAGEDLERSLGLYPTLMISIGAMIGSGIFVLPAIGFDEAGPSVVLADVQECVRARRTGRVPAVAHPAGSDTDNAGWCRPRRADRRTKHLRNGTHRPGTGRRRHGGSRRAVRVRR